MPGFTESNITLDFPDDQYFRFQDCLAYKKLSANHFKEMDACWLDAKDNTFWLIELKDFTVDLSSGNGIEDRVWGIVKKAVDSLQMMLSVKHGYPFGKSDLQPCILPRKPDVDSKFCLFAVIHCPPAYKVHVQLLHNSFRAKFEPYAKLFGIERYGVLEHTRALTAVPNGIVK